MTNIFRRLKQRIETFECYRALLDWQFNEKVIEAFQGLNEKQKDEVMICIVEQTEKIR